MTSVTTRSASTTSAKRSRRRRYISEAGSDLRTSPARDRWQKSVNQTAKVDRDICEERLADLRRALKAPAWVATVAAMGQEGGEP
jgi:hypothetical protein